MKRNIIVLLVLSVLLSCEKEKDQDFESLYFWTPTIQIEKGDNQATLHLNDPRAFTNYHGPAPSNPDYFEILVSENNMNFSLYDKIDISTKSITIQNLINGNPYAVKVTSHKEKYDSDTSNTVLTIPSEEQSVEFLFGNAAYSVERVSGSFDMSYMSFISNNYFNNTGRDILYFKATNADTIKIIDVDSYNAAWSETTNSLVYLTSKQEGSRVYPDKLKIFEPETKVSTTLLQVHYDNYYIMNPRFYSNGEMITFLSSENNSEKHFYDLWSFNLNSQEQTRITNFEDAGFLINSGYAWNMSGEAFYMDGRYNSSVTTNDIFKMDTKTMLIVPVVKSPWNDRNPSLSPDNTKLLFISDRTGKDEVWQIKLDEQKLMQITGGKAFHFDSRYSNIQWINNTEILITVFENAKSKALKVHLD